MKNVYFNFPQRYDSGIIPKVSITNGVVVEVHQSQAASTLWYHVGTLTGNLVEFGDSHQYDKGITPSVAVNAQGIVVEAHETQSPFSSGMYYHVGRVDSTNKTISFGDSHNYDNGNVPRVALNDQDVVVEVHESNGPSANMWYHVGKVNASNQTIDFGASQQYDKGATPAVAINNEGVVVEVHQSNGPSTALWYHVGVVDTSKNTIDFGPSIQYDHGSLPSVALTDDGFVIEVHRSQSFNTLWKWIGQVDVAQKRINWIGGSVYYTDGDAPCVGVDNTMAVEVHQDGSNLYYAASRVLDRSNWMHDAIPIIGELALRDVPMPASHDAGMYMTQGCKLASSCNTQTQNLSILGQLQAGIRYFDLRPTLYDGTLYTAHFDTGSGFGCNGDSLANILSEVKTYFGDGKDLVILKFSHYYDRDNGTTGFSEVQMKQLLDLVTSTLQPVLYTGPVPADGLSGGGISSYLSSGGCVLAVFDDLSSTLKSQYTGVYSYADKGESGDLVVYDRYSNTNDLDEMISDQLKKLEDPSNHGENLFLLSWTLTQSTAQAIFCTTHMAESILDLAQEANTALWPNLLGAYQQGKITPTQMPNLIYVDDCQGFVTDFAVWLNEQLYSGRVDSL